VSPFDHSPSSDSFSVVFVDGTCGDKKKKSKKSK